MRKDKDDIHVEIGTGSVYEQLGFKDYKEMEAKAKLVIEMREAIKKRKLTQTNTAKILRISQPKLFSLLNGHFRGFSVEQLTHFLNELS